MEGGDDEAFNNEKVDLRYTPRQMTLLSTTVGANNEQRKILLAVVESDYNDYGLEGKNAMGFDATGEGNVAKKEGGKASCRRHPAGSICAGFVSRGASI